MLTKSILIRVFTECIAFTAKRDNFLREILLTLEKAANEVGHWINENKTMNMMSSRRASRRNMQCYSICDNNNKSERSIIYIEYRNSNKLFLFNVCYCKRDRNPLRRLKGKIEEYRAQQVKQNWHCLISKITKDTTGRTCTKDDRLTNKTPKWKHNSRNFYWMTEKTRIDYVSQDLRKVTARNWRSVVNNRVIWSRIVKETQAHKWL